MPTKGGLVGEASSISKKLVKLIFLVQLERFNAMNFHDNY
jgi:hypothetical protein